jgi:hypothetical protein
MEFVSDVLEESVEIFLQEIMLISQDIAPLDHHVVGSDEDLIEFFEPSGFGQLIQNLPGSLMQLGKQVSHFIKGIDFLCVQILKRLAVSGQLFVSGFHFWHKLFHFSVVCVIFFGQFDVDHAFVVLAVRKVSERFGFLRVRFYAVEFRAL